jgi:hypothetical protein
MIRIDSEKKKIKVFAEVLRENGFTEISSLTGGDDDFLYVDPQRREFIFCENGSPIFSSQEEMDRLVKEGEPLGTLQAMDLLLSIGEDPLIESKYPEKFL